MRKSKAKGDDGTFGRIITYLQSQINFCIELDERFRMRNYSPEVEESLLRQNDAKLQQLERDLVRARAGAY
jgi:hypothetical protein